MKGIHLNVARYSVMPSLRQVCDRARIALDLIENDATGTSILICELPFMLL